MFLNKVAGIRVLPLRFNLKAQNTASAAERLQTLNGQVPIRRQTTNCSDSKFRFTLNDPALTEEQRQSYEKNGFLLVKNLVPHQLLDDCSQRFRDLCEGKVSPGRISMFKDVSMAKRGVTGEKLFNRIQTFLWDDVLFQFSSLPEIVNYVKCFTGPNVTAVYTMLINKPPEIGPESRQPLHQDLYYFPFRPADRIVAVWTAMERMTQENGCLAVLPGTHTGTLLPHDYPEWNYELNNFYYGVDRIDLDADNRIHVEMEKGDTLFFHPILIHGSGSNRSKDFRKAISTHYAASECNFVDIKGTSQEYIATEVERIYKKKGKPVKYNDVWKFTSRLISGVRTNL